MNNDFDRGIPYTCWFRSWPTGLRRRRCTYTSMNTLPQSRHFATRGWLPAVASHSGTAPSRQSGTVVGVGDGIDYGRHASVLRVGPAPARRARARSSRRRGHGAAGGASGCVRRPRAGGVDAALALSRLPRRRQRCAMPRSPVPSTCGTPPPRSTGRFRTPPASGSSGLGVSAEAIGLEPVVAAGRSDGRCARR